MGHHVKRYMLPSLGGAGRGPGKAERGTHPARRSARAGDPRPPQPEPGAPSADDAGTPDHRGGRGEAARPRRAERTAEQSSRGGDGGEDAPQPTPNQAGDGPETDPGRAGGRPAKRGALRPARGPGPPERAGESERPTRARAQQPRRGRRPTSAAEQRRAEALERSEKPSGRDEGSLPQSRAASPGERGRGRVPEAPRVLDERSRGKRLWRSQCRAAERLSGGRPPGPNVVSVPTRYMDVISSRC